MVCDLINGLSNKRFVVFDNVDVNIYTSNILVFVCIALTDSAHLFRSMGLNFSKVTFLKVFIDYALLKTLF